LDVTVPRGKPVSEELLSNDLIDIVLTSTSSMRTCDQHKSVSNSIPPGFSISYFLMPVRPVSEGLNIIFTKTMVSIALYNTVCRTAIGCLEADAKKITIGSIFVPQITLVY
tara:strand:- start:821 stop:1153 length:333 start_codon:yes stop_codon:yes gene_type:complete